MTRRDLLAFLRLAPPATLVPAAEVLAALQRMGQHERTRRERGGAA